MATYGGMNSTDSEDTRRRKAEASYWKTTSSVGRSDPIEDKPRQRRRESEQDETNDWREGMEESFAASWKDEAAEESFAASSKDEEVGQRTGGYSGGSSREYRSPDSDRRIERYQRRNDQGKGPRRTLSLNNMGPRFNNRGRHRGGAFQNWRAQANHWPRHTLAAGPTRANHQRTAETDGEYYWNPRPLGNSPRRAELPNQAARGMSGREVHTDNTQLRERTLLLRGQRERRTGGVGRTND